MLHFVLLMEYGAQLLALKYSNETSSTGPRNKLGLVSDSQDDISTGAKEKETEYLRTMYLDYEMSLYWSFVVTCRL